MQSLVCVLFAVVDFDNMDTSWRKYDTSKDDSSSVDLICGILALHVIVIPAHFIER